MDLAHSKKENWFHRSKDGGDSVVQDENFIPHLPRHVRDRLHALFTQIEQEFSEIYAENTELRKKLDNVKKRRPLNDSDNTTEKQSDNHNWNGSEATHKSSFKSKGGLSSSHLSQKLKTTYKSGTSKLVSSFKPTSNVICKVAQELTGHKDGVRDVCANPTDSNLIASASADQTAKLWNLQTGACVATYKSHTGSVNCARFHPTNRLVLTASGDRTVHLWPYESSSRWSNNNNDNNEDRSNSKDSDTSPSMENNSPIGGGGQQRNGIRETLMRNLSHSQPVVCCDWLHDGIQFVTASWDRTACLVDSSTNQTLQTLTGHDLPLTYVSAHPTQKLVVTSSRDGTFRVCDFRVPAIHTVTVGQGHSRAVAAAVLTTDDKIVSSSDDRFVKVWDLKSMRTPISTMRFDSPVNRISVSPRGLIAIPHDNRQVRIFDMAGVRLARLPRNDRTSHRRVVTSACWMNDYYQSTTNNNGVDNMGLITCGWDRIILHWNIQIPTVNNQ